MAAYLGLRWGELAGLLVSAVDLREAPPASFPPAEPAEVGPPAEPPVGASGGRGERGPGGVVVGPARDGGPAEAPPASEASGGRGERPPAGMVVGLAREGSPAGASPSAAKLRVVGALEEVAGCARCVSEGKSTSSLRTLTMPRCLAEELSAYLRSFGIDSLVPMMVDAPWLPGGAVASSQFVFTDVDGSVLRGARFRRRYWKPAVARAGLPSELRFHDLRHTCASLLIAQGAHPKEIQARLGHSSIRTTLDTYGHLLPNLGARLDEGLDRLFQEVNGHD